MLTSFVLSMTLAAPVPAPAPPVAPGPAPRILELKPNPDGKIMVAVTRTEKVQIGVNNAVPPGGAAPVVLARDVSRVQLVELSAVKDLTVTTADGKKIATEDALKQLSTGANVVVSTDGKPVSPTFLKLFKDDVLVLVSPELTGPAAGPIGRPGVRPLPLELQPAPGVQILPAQPGAVQIQIAPAVLVPAAPARPVAPPPGK